MGRRVSNPSGSRRLALAFLTVAGVLGCAGPAFADHLEVAADAPWWMRLGADAILTLHIGGGTAGMISGTTALLSRKGGKLHRRAGAIFFVSMLVMSGIGNLQGEARDAMEKQLNAMPMLAAEEIAEAVYDLIRDDETLFSTLASVVRSGPDPATGRRVVGANFIGELPEDLLARLME